MRIAAAVTFIIFMIGCSGSGLEDRDPTSLGDYVPLKPSDEDCSTGGGRANVFGSWYLDFEGPDQQRYRHIYIFRSGGVRFIKVCENGVRSIVDAAATINDVDIRFIENKVNVAQSGSQQCEAQVSKKIWEYTINGSCLQVQDPAGNEELTFRSGQ